MSLSDADRELARHRHRLERLRGEIQQNAEWIGRLERYLQQILDSSRWRIGHMLVNDVAKRLLRRRNRDAPWAPHRAREILGRYRNWRQGPGTIHFEEAADGFSGQSAVTPHTEEVGEALANRRRSLSELTDELATADKDLAQLGLWLEGVYSSIERILASRRWRVGDLLVNDILKRLLRPRSRRLPWAPQHAREVMRRYRAACRERMDAGASVTEPSLSHLASSFEARCHGKTMKLLEPAAQDRLAASLEQLAQADLVSIVMPTWNRASTIQEAIASVHAQSYGNWELLIIDDGSTDDTAQIIESKYASDKRVKYFRTEHLGVSRARTSGLQRARGEVVAYLDSDNTWDPDFLLFAVNTLRATRRSSVYSALKIVDHDRNQEVSFRKFAFDLAMLRRNNYIDINVFAHQRSVLDTTGPFDDSLKRWVDWDFILRIVTVSPPAMIPIALCTYSKSTALGQITTKESYANKHKVLNKHLIEWDKVRAATTARRSGQVTVIIPVYKRSDLTRQCLRHIFSSPTRIPFDVLVVDNGSTDRTEAVVRGLQRRHQRLGYIRNYENYGFALGCNLGFAASSGEYVVFLNNDTIVTPGWLDALVRPLVENPAVGITGPKLLFPNDQLQSGGMVFGSRSKIPYNIYQKWPSDHPAVNKRRYFQAVTGACLATRAADYAALGGFDCLYLNGCEDIDYCLRVTGSLGKRVIYVPDSVLTHLEGQTEGRSRNIMYNRELFVERWGDSLERDDLSYFTEDGYEVESYDKPGTEPDGPTAAYYPSLARTLSPSRPQVSAPARTWAKPIPQRLLNVGFCSIWHYRGIAFHTKQLAEALESPAIRTHVFARWESSRFCNEGSIFHPRVLNAGDDPGPEVIVDWARANSLDLVIFMEVHPRDWKRVAALQKAGIRVMAYENLDILRRDLTDRYQSVDYLLFNAFFARDVFAKLCPETPGLLIPWGIRPDSRPQTDSAVNKSGPLRFVHVAGWGGLNNRKNSDLVMRTFHEGRLEEAQLHFYTQAPLASYGADCVKIARSNDRILVHEGTVPDIAVAYRESDILLWPSKREGLGLPIVEALVSGLPVLISDGYMMKQWPVRDEHGVICPAPTKEGMMFLPELRVAPEALLEKLRELVSNRSALEEMRFNVARDRAAWLWDWQSDVFRSEIRRMAENPGHRPAEDLSYLPTSRLEFETRRAARECAHSGTPGEARATPG